jgi:hypothetical protein
MNKTLFVFVIPLVIALVGTGQLAYATNENDYKYGFQHGKIEYGHCTYRGDQDEYCEAGGNVCTDTSITNQTACIDGFINSWNKVCTHSMSSAFDGTSKVVCPDIKTNEGLPYNY